MEEALSPRPAYVHRGNSPAACSNPVAVGREKGSSSTREAERFLSFLMVATTKEILSRSARETISYAKAFAGKLKAGDVVALSGELGSGKTTFVKGVALGLGLRDADEVKSPTFTILHVYPARIPLYHVDLYRLDHAAEIAAIGFEEWVENPGAIVCVEWAEKAKDLLPAGTHWVRLELTAADSRRILLRS